MRVVLFVTALLFVASAVSAAEPDARNGSLFGYHLGDTYPVTTKTRYVDKSGGLHRILAENPNKPNEIGNVYLLITVKSHKIVQITSETEIRPPHNPAGMVGKYTRLLRAKYSDAQDVTDDFERKYGHLVLMFDDRYQLFVRLMDNWEPPTMKLGLGTAGEFAKHLHTVADREYAKTVLKDAGGQLKGM